MWLYFFDVVTGDSSRGRGGMLDQTCDSECCDVDRTGVNRITDIALTLIAAYVVTSLLYV